MSITTDDLAHILANAAKVVDVEVAREVKATAQLIKESMKSNIPRASGHIADSTQATGPDGSAFTATTLVAEIEPKWFGGLIEHGTVNTPPRPYAEASTEPHMPDHQARTLKAGTTGALKGLIG